ncbi:MAG: hypothetical protein AAF621_00895 [Pseudomonadota bacterium]
MNGVTGPGGRVGSGPHSSGASHVGKAPTIRRTSTTRVTGNPNATADFSSRVGTAAEQRGLPVPAGSSQSGPRRSSPII